MTPLVLGGLGLVLGLLAIWAYPSSAAELPTPAYSRLTVTASFPIGTIEYGVVQNPHSQSISEIKIVVKLPDGTASPPAHAQLAFLSLTPPFGIAFTECPASYCSTVHGAGGQVASTTVAPLIFSKGTVEFSLYVKAQNFGVTSNGRTASAVMPQVIYRAPGTPVLLVSYEIPSVASYDWSSFPAALAGGSVAVWQEDLISGDTPARSAVGINHAQQESDETMTFLAGALLGLAGGAILSAVQEALHAND